MVIFDSHFLAAEDEFDQPIRDTGWYLEISMDASLMGCYTTPSSQEVMRVGQAPNPYLRLLALSVSCLPFWSLLTTCIRRLRSD
jgi:hypothetical protein